jgi:hypothetical protein
MARTKKRPPKEPLQVCSIKLPPAVAASLAALALDASDHLDRPVSVSTIARAALTYLAWQSAGWTVTNLYPLMEQEIAHGRVWGRKPKK